MTTKQIKNIEKSKVCKVIKSNLETTTHGRARKVVKKAQFKSTLNDEIYNILDEIQNGSSVVKACKKRSISTKTFYDLINNTDNLKDLYVIAIQSRGDASLDKINDVLKDLEMGKIDPQTARVIIDTEKWKASKFYPKLYGDKTEVELNSNTIALQKIYITEQEQKAINTHIDEIVNK